jgi:hypothetical protein
MAVQIVKGSYKEIIVRLKNSDGDPIDLSSATEIEACFPAADGSEVMLSLTDTTITLMSGVLGKFKLILSSVNSALLLAATNRTLEVSYTIGGNITKIQLPLAYSVVESLC